MTKASEDAENCRSLNLVGERKVTIADLLEAKERGVRLVSVGAFDTPSAQLLDEAGVPIIAVGDSIGVLHLGHRTVAEISLDELIHHAKAVVRGVDRALVIADLPFGTYQTGPAEALKSATRLMKEAGVDAVKPEATAHLEETVRVLVDSGVPVAGHIGFTPQRERQLSGFHVQGRSRAEAERLVRESQMIEAAGAFALFLELVEPAAAGSIAEAVRIPTIGSGAGPATDGQIIPWNWLLGIAPVVPKFSQKYANLRPEIIHAIERFAGDLQQGGGGLKQAIAES